MPDRAGPAAADLPNPAEILLQAAGPCALYDGIGRLVRGNPAWHELRAEVTQLEATLISRVLQAGRVARHRRSLDTAAGRRIFAIRYSAAPLAPSKGIIATYQDVTREAEALEALRRHRERSQDLLNVISDWVFEIDTRWCLTYQAARPGTRLSSDSRVRVGSSLFDLGTFEAQPGGRRSRLPAPGRRALFRDVPFRIRLADDSDVVLSLSATPLFDPDTGAFEGFRGAGTDITARLLAEREAAAYRGRLEDTLAALRIKNSELEQALAASRAAERAKSDFLAVMSHELRTPLNAIIGFTETMDQELFGPLDKQYQEYAGDILASARHLLDLINDILDYVKFQAGESILHPEPVEIGKLIDSCRRLIAATAAAHSITLDSDVPPGMVWRADEKRLRQVLLNLLSNAVKFTSAGGRITVGAARDDAGWLAISVADTGIGIPADRLAFVLEPFKQVDSSLSRRFEGTGLGLPLCKEIAELHGGSLAIDSEEGRGTTVTVRLPET